MSRGVCLGFQTEPTNIELDCGAVLLCHPYTSYIKTKARLISEAWNDALLLGEETILDIDGEVFGLPDVDDLEGRAALGHSLFVEALALCAVVDWENVVDLKTKQPLELGELNIRWLVRNPEIMDNFLLKYTASLEMFRFEGKD